MRFMAKKRSTKKRKKKSSKEFLYTILIALLLLGIAGTGFFLYTLGYEQGYKQAQEEYKKKAEQTKVKTLQKKKPKTKTVRNVEKKHQAALSEIEDYKRNSEQMKEPSVLQPKHEKAIDTDKPKLAIIIDDVAYGYQAKAIKNLGIPINPSFFPPSPRHPKTPQYAAMFSHYMIHLPMEANHYLHEEPDTLRITSSLQTIERVIAKIRKEFPKAKVINNHTGSRFTANYEAMKRLYKILDKYHFVFLDSRTTAQTVVPKIDRELGRTYLARNVFLDNEQNVPYIKNQLRQAIALAKKRGLAIAIGHPHPATLKALRESKDILNQVQLIYIDSLLK
ncbi:hypothetical protein NitYY0814_C1238 [Nitratiruptor sp. YY08-14]|nr:hypothetical protein NitYY0810_C0883 [Nitratiruptor sp. YY08-10]BCD64393.1 hypothetical protein NitYY0814_C1238 [Nitratiruptor sp. YY08-14]